MCGRSDSHSILFYGVIVEDLIELVHRLRAIKRKLLMKFFER